MAMACTLARDETGARHGSSLVAAKFCLWSDSLGTALISDSACCNHYTAPRRLMRATSGVDGPLSHMSGRAMWPPCLACTFDIMHPFQPLALAVDESDGVLLLAHTDGRSMHSTSLFSG